MDNSSLLKHELPEQKLLNQKIDVPVHDFKIMKLILMVTIIGMLLSVAIPNYLYLEAKAHTQQTIPTLDKLITVINEHHQLNQTLPNIRQIAQRLPLTIQGQYLVGHSGVVLIQMHADPSSDYFSQNSDHLIMEVQLDDSGPSSTQYKRYQVTASLHSHLEKSRLVYTVSTANTSSLDSQFLPRIN